MQFIESINGMSRVHRRGDSNIVLRDKWFFSSDFDLFDPGEQLTHMVVLLIRIIFTIKTAK